MRLCTLKICVTQCVYLLGRDEILGLRAILCSYLVIEQSLDRIVFRLHLDQPTAYTNYKTLIIRVKLLIFFKVPLMNCLPFLKINRSSSCFRRLF